jgi:hypothetical protein
MKNVVQYKGLNINPDTVKVMNQIDVTKWAVLLPQHVAGTSMPIIRSTISECLPLLGGHTWKAAWVV